MSVPVQVELIRVVPTIIWAAGLLTVVLIFRGTITERLAGVQRLSVFGVEVEIDQRAVQAELDEAATRVPAGTAETRDRTVRRAARLAGLLLGARILVVNDVPREMASAVRLLESLGMTVETVTSTDAAIEALGRGQDVVVSDMVRGADTTAGLGLIERMRSRHLTAPVILTPGQFQPERGVPPYAFGITNRVDELLNLIFDALERVRA